MMKRILLLLAVAAVVPGCGSSHHTSRTTLPTVLPLAKNPDQWAVRIVEFYLRPLNRELVVVNGFNNPQIVRYIVSQNRTTLRIVRQRLADLARCSDRLVAIGPPPASRAQLEPVYRSFKDACVSYVEMAGTLQQAALDLSSGRTDVIAEGRKLLLRLRPVSAKAGTNFAAGLRAAQVLPEFRRAGLRPSA
jgi:hypothetical protein